MPIPPAKKETKNAVARDLYVLSAKRRHTATSTFMVIIAIVCSACSVFAAVIVFVLRL